MTEKRWHARLLQAGLRPTRQRLNLAELLFAHGDRHVTAEMLHAEALASDIQVALATIYNTLHQFVQAGLLREVAIEGAKTFFDTNTSKHFHFLLEHEGTLVDIPAGNVAISNLPPAPEGTEIARIDILVRLARRRMAASV
jgi:Fur family transcriptional regulator, iron response regulator